MNTFKSMTKTVNVTDPLPPSWIRINETRPEPHEQLGAGMLSAGPRAVLRDALVRAIEGANETVLLASFLFSDEQLCQALLDVSERGVRVYMLTASGSRLQSRDDDEFSQRMVAEHERLLNRLAGKVGLRSAPEFHAKFVVVDHRSHARGWLSTANLNPALTEAVELGVELDQPSAVAVAGGFCRMFWAHAEHELIEKNRLTAVRKPPALPPEPDSTRVWVTTPTGTQLRERLLGWVRGAKREIILSSYGLEPDHDLVRAVIERARSGIDVTVLTRVRPANTAAVLALHEAGARVLGHDKLHAKAVICDDDAIVMTANLAKHGLDGGFEVGLPLGGEQRALLRATLRRWAGWFPWRFEGQAQRADVVGEICLASEGLRDGKRQVIAEQVVNLGDVVADDALSLDAAPRPKLKPPNTGNSLPTRLVYEWRVVAPRLPAKAKPLKQRETVVETDKRGQARTRVIEVDYPLPVYGDGKQRYVVIEAADRTEQARELAERLEAKVVVR